MGDKYKFRTVSVSGIWQSGPEMYHFQIEGEEVTCQQFNDMIQANAEKLREAEEEVKRLQKLLDDEMAAYRVAHKQEETKIKLLQDKIKSLRNMYEREPVDKTAKFHAPSYTFEHMNLSDVPDATKMGLKVGGAERLKLDFVVDREGKITATGLDVECSKCGTDNSIDIEGTCCVCGSDEEEADG